MSEAAATPPLRRFLLEGVVIVASILLAFAIDAAWSQLQQSEEEERILETVAAELREIVDNSRFETRYQAERVARIDRILAQLGPEAVAADPEAFWQDISGIIRTGTPLLATGGIDGLFESGGLQLIDDIELRGRLVEWRKDRQFFEAIGDFIDDYTDRFNTYLLEMGVGGAMPDLLPGGSAFPIEPSILLRDPVFESNLVYLKGVVESWSLNGHRLTEGASDLAAYVDSVRAAR